MQHLAMHLWAHTDAAHADRVEFNWGHAYYDAKNPMCHAANHALITQGACTPGILKDVQQFYTHAGLSPRITVPVQAAQAATTLAMLHGQGWQAHVCTAQVWIQTQHFLHAQPCADVMRVRGLFGTLMDQALELLGLWGAQALKRRLRQGEHSQLYMLAPQGNPVAMGMLRLISATHPPLALIEDLIVSPSQRGKGLGTCLMRHMLHQHRIQHPAVPLLLCTSSLLGKKFYTPLGFSLIQQLPVRIRAHWQQPSLLSLEEPS